MVARWSDGEDSIGSGGAAGAMVARGSGTRGGWPAGRAYPPLTSQKWEGVSASGSAIEVRSILFKARP